MNLISDSWLPVLTKDGQKIKIKPAQLSNPNISELNLPRLDFQGAAYQLLIGLLQTTFAPKNIDEWIKYYEAPANEETLQAAFDQVAHAFNVIGDKNRHGPRFMQDFDDLASVNSINSIANLLIESPGDNTLKLNKDFFIKRDLVTTLSVPIAALALFTLQINAPSGGAGHRTGLRGGGPMTTLVRPNEADSSLWHKLWWNVINRQGWKYPDPDFTDGSVFPWLAPTRVSDKTGGPIYRDNVHPLHIYWAMPRRIRLILETIDKPASEKIPADFTGKVVDDLTGEPCEQVICHYRTQNYGANYEGDWSPHPITPYRFNPKKPEDSPYSIKAQPGGITYKLWHMLTFSAKQKESGFIRAMVLDQANEIYEDSEGEFSAHRLWAFSYDMDNMKARGFYSKELPIYYISEHDQEQLLATVIELHELTENVVKQLRNSIKFSWMSERQAKESKGDMSMIDIMFWQRSERIFFSAIKNAVNHQGQLTSMAASQWLNKICNLAKQIFDEQVLASDKVEQRHMAQLDSLNAFLYGNKQLSAFRNRQKVSVSTEN